MIEKVTWTKFERNPLENKSFEIFISETLIRSAPLAKLLSQLPESPIQLTYFTIIIFLVSKLSFSVKKLKKYQIGKKLWLLEVTVKFFLELVLFKWCISQNFFQKSQNWVDRCWQNQKICVDTKNQPLSLKNSRFTDAFVSFPNPWKPEYFQSSYFLISYGYDQNKTCSYMVWHITFTWA